jgi:DNA-binding CsgD family transcriptional regulator
MTPIHPATGLSTDFDVAILHAVAKSATRNELEAITTIFCHRYGLERWIYAMIGPDVAVTNYEAEWLNFYAQHRCQRRRDPFVCAIYERRRAISWDLEKRPPWSGRLTRMQQHVIDAKWDAGVRAGVTAPIFGPTNHGSECAIISFSRERTLTGIEAQHLEPWIHLFATYFQSAASSIWLQPAKPAASVALTQREKDCLRWAAEGKSSRAIAETLSVSMATVEFHLSNAAAKLGTRGRAYSIAKAIRTGLIEVG